MTVDLRRETANTWRMLEIIAEVTHKKLALEELQMHGDTMMKRLRVQSQDVTIMLVDDAAIKKLNRQYRKKNKPTDVLSFSMKEGEFTQFAPTMLGDIVISVQTAEKQAKEKKHTLQKEVTFLTAHGLLHLLGYDHETDKEEAAMNKKTEAVMADLFGATKKLTAKKKPASKKPLAAKKSAAKKKTVRKR
jgi:probable rRNA maturation factor